jgi:hypothetical protein
LGTREVLAERPRLAGEGVATEQHTGAGTVVEVAEHHRLDRDGGAEVVGDAVVAAVPAGPTRVPRREDRAGGGAELLGGDLRHRRARGAEDRGPPLRRLLVLREIGALMAQHDLGVEAQESAVGVASEPRVAALPGQGRLDGVGDPQVQDGVHHAGHRHRGAGADGDQQRAVGAAEVPPGLLLQPLHGVVDLTEQLVVPLRGPVEPAERVGGHHDRGWGGDADRLHSGDGPRLPPDQLPIRQTGTVESDDHVG